ncbi:MAG: hypothetical protein IKI31_01410 [Treponema sp.]|nr:hypothetical protein [Treponema sp.]
MSNSLTEKKVLKKLDIPDFRHMTKDKIVGFVSMLSKMDPEVAKKALEQFPEYAKTNLAVVNCIKEEFNTVFQNNRENMQTFNSACSQILESLTAELEKEEIDNETRSLISERMLLVAKMMYEKDSENKKFHVDIAKTICSTVYGICLAAAVVLGVNVIARNSKE